MPLTYHNRLIADLLKQLRERLLAAVEPFSVVDNAIDMTVFAGENHRPAGRTNRIGAEAVFKQHSLFGKSVEVRRLIYLAAVAAKRVRSVVVCHNKDNVRPFSSPPYCLPDTRAARQQR